MPRLTSSVLVPSHRPVALARCLAALAKQTVPPDQVLVVWQGEDTATRDVALRQTGINLQVVHSPKVGIVPAENVALAASTGDVILLIDDDAVPPPRWLASHLSHYADSTVGAVGGPCLNFSPDGSPFPSRAVEPIGTVTWFGKLIGNLFDHPVAWRSRPPIEIDHLAGGNLSLRRKAFARFESRLLKYWQHFETDACFQVKSRGYRVLFDFGNTVDHYPTSGIFSNPRTGDLEIKVINLSFNHSFIISRYFRRWRRIAAWLYLFGVGSVASPGLLASLYSIWKYRDVERELDLFRRVLLSKRRGWLMGIRSPAESLLSAVAKPGCESEHLI